MDRPYGSKNDVNADLETQRGLMLVYTVDEWRLRNRSVKVKGLTRLVLIMIYSYFLGSLLLLWWTGLLEDEGNLFYRLFDLFPCITVLFFTITVVSISIAYYSKMSRPLAGVYENGVGLSNGTFLPYLTMFGVERDRRYGPFRSDQVVFHTGEVKGEGSLWGDSTPRLPFEFLEMDGLVTVMEIMDRDPTRGPPLRKEPELVIYGPGGPVR